MLNFINSCGNHQLEIFESFRIEEKILELKELVKDQKLDIFDGSNVVIAVPSIDESGRSIFKDDRELYHVQRRDAYKLAEFIKGKTESKVLDIILDADKIVDLSCFVNKQIDYVLFLHEFLEFERDYILNELKKSGHRDLQVIELY